MPADEMYELLKELFPICRSITGRGVRLTLRALQKIVPDLVINEVPSGTRAFDWEVPPEWNINDAWVQDQEGNKVIDFNKSNLHVVSYSQPVDKIVSRRELEDHLYSLPEQPDAIPYVTSYYKRRWGFCLSHNDRQRLKGDKFRVFIDSTLDESGSLTYGELFIPGSSDTEVLLSTNICHPSLANNELSGPVVAAFLARHFSRAGCLTRGLRFLFLPETIGSIVYLSRNFVRLKRKLVGGYVLTCLGDDRDYSYLQTRNGHTVSDQAVVQAYRHLRLTPTRYSFLYRGSDERQFNSPGVDLPIASIMRTKHRAFPEYHTSLDNLDLVTPKGLEGGYRVVKTAVDIILRNRYPRLLFLCEPQLGKRGLYPQLSTASLGLQVRNMMNLIAYSDGSHSLLDLSEMLDLDFYKLEGMCSLLEERQILASSPSPSSPENFPQMPHRASGAF